MADFGVFEATLTREELGLAPLNLNSGDFKVSAGLLGGTQSWRRQAVSSPYVDGEFTVNRVRTQVQERLGVEIRGATQGLLQANIATVIAAITQFRYQLRLGMDDAVYTYACETADYTLDWTASRFMARQALLTMSVPRSPKLVNGGW